MNPVAAPRHTTPIGIRRMVTVVWAIAIGAGVFSLASPTAAQSHQTDNGSSENGTSNGADEHGSHQHGVQANPPAAGGGPTSAHPGGQSLGPSPQGTPWLTDEAWLGSARSAALPSLDAGRLRTYQTRYFTLRTDTDVDYAAHLADYLDAYHEALAQNMRTLFHVDIDVPRPSILLFERQVDYQAFASEHAPQLVNNGGYYDGGSRTIVTYRFNNSMQLYFHEIIHAVMGEVFGDHVFLRYTRKNWPIWFDEGLAEYFGSFELRGDVLRIGAVNPTKVAYVLNAAQRGTLIDLRTLLTSGPGRFSGRMMNIYYAASWSLFSYLASNDELRGQLPSFLARLRNGADGLAAFTDCFGPDLDALDRDWRQWLVQLRGRTQVEQALFDGATIDDWTVHEGGTWRVQGGEIVAVGDEQYNYLIKSDLPRDSFRLRTRVRLEAGTVGLILGNNFHEEYPYYYLIDLSENRLSLRRSWSPTDIRPIAEAAVDLHLGEWVDLEVAVTGSRLRLRVDGKLVVDVPEDREQYSLFGLYLFRAQARFRDIALAPVAKTLPSPPKSANRPPSE